MSLCGLWGSLAAVKIDWTHILIVLISALFIVVLALLARGNAQLWSVVTAGAAAWITTVVALLKLSPLQPPPPAVPAAPDAPAQDADATLNPNDKTEKS